MILKRVSIGVLTTCILFSGGVYGAEPVQGQTAVDPAGKTIVIPQQATEGQTVENAGVKMKVTEIVPGQAGTLVKLAAERKDGSAFPDSVSLRNIEMYLIGEQGLEGISCFSAGYSTDLSEDKKTLLIEYRVISEEPIANKNILFSTSTIEYREAVEKPLGVTLKSIYDKAPLTITKEEAKSNFEKEWTARNGAMSDLPDGADTMFYLMGDWFPQWIAQEGNAQVTKLPVAAGFPEAELGGVLFVGDDLYIHTTKVSAASKAFVTVDKLLDSRTGEYISSSAGSDGLSKFDGVKESDLAYLTPSVQYMAVRNLSEGPWDFNLKVGDPVGKKAVLNKTIQCSERPLTVKDVSVDLLGVHINAGRSSGGVLEDIDVPQVKLLLKDGSEVSLTLTAQATGPDNKLSMSYERMEQINGEINIKPINKEMLEKVDSLMIGDMKVKL